MWIRKKERDITLLATVALVMLMMIAIYPTGLFTVLKEQCKSTAGFSIMEVTDGKPIVPVSVCKKFSEDAKATTLRDIGNFIENTIGWDAYYSALDNGENNIFDELQKMCYKEHSGRIASCGYSERFYCCVS